jgi:hypothetical protein
MMPSTPDGSAVQPSRRLRPRPLLSEKDRVRTLAFFTLLLWLVTFATGLLIPSDSYRMALLDIELGTPIREIARNALVAGFLFAPLNVGYLCLFAGYIGGCVSNVTFHALDERTRGNTNPARLAYLREPPTNAMLRSFVVYLLLLGGLFAFLPDPFGLTTNSASGSTTTAQAVGKGIDLTAAAAKQATYARLASLVSVLAFVIGFDPTRLQGLFDMIPVVGRKQDGDADSTSPAARSATINGQQIGLASEPVREFRKAEDEETTGRKSETK